MVDAVNLVRSHASQLPEDIQADLQLKFFKLCQDMESFTTLWTPVSREVAKRQLISEEEEQKRLEVQRKEAIEKVRKKEQLDVIVEAEEQSENSDATRTMPSVPSREDLYNMCLSLQKQIRNNEDKIYALENNNKKEDVSTNTGDNAATD